MPAHPPSGSLVPPGQGGGLARGRQRPNECFVSLTSNLLSRSPVWTNIKMKGVRTSLKNISSTIHSLYSGGIGFTQSILAAVTELNGLEWMGEWGADARSLLNLGWLSDPETTNQPGFPEIMITDLHLMNNYGKTIDCEYL